jgi:BirA family biotin operon repressor/biotin-[acetyl-CoA-carboxylase] ligase
MSNLDADLLRQLAQASSSGRLQDVEVFAEIDSTNSYLMHLPGPAPGNVRIAVTNNQTAGRGRHGKVWQSPAGSGLCLSAAYTFASQPGNLPALTLAIGLAVVRALEELGAVGVELKWPNDLVVLDGKLGGILTEVQRQSAEGVTVVTGVGINLNLVEALEPGMKNDWARQIVDLKQVCDASPPAEEVAGLLAKHLITAFVDYEKTGFEPIAEYWSQYDWLRGRHITVDTAAEQVSGIGAGVAEDGALLIHTTEAGIRRITSGTIVFAGARGEKQ